MPNLDTPHRLEVVNLWALWIVPFAIMSALVGGCAPPEKPPSHVLLQWLQADGVCREDHATQSGNYTGDRYRRKKQRSVVPLVATVASPTGTQ